MEDSPKDWREVKANLVRRFGTITAAARHFQCSVSALRKLNACPAVAEKLRKENLLAV